MGSLSIDSFRGRNIGVVFQRLHLIASLTVLQNVLVAQYAAGLPVQPEKARQVLDSLGVGDRADVLPAQLSQGQAQRVAIARAVINRPRLILADEPTSSLDDDSAAVAIKLLIEQANACEAVLLVATHDSRAKTAIARRIVLGAAA